MIADATDQKIESLAGAVVDVMAETAGRKTYEEALWELPGFEGAFALNSRKGTCYEIKFAGMPSIFAKSLENGQKAENEKNCSKILNDGGINCPVVLARSGRIIARRFLEGKTASDELDTLQSLGDCTAASKLCKRIGGMLRQVHGLSLHEGTSLALKDLNLKNFIVSRSGDLSLIDLEDAGIGPTAVDLGALIVHILTHRPSFSKLSWQMAEAAFESYCSKAAPDFDLGEWKEGLKAAIEEAALRRKDPTLIDHMQEMLGRTAVWKLPKKEGGR